MFRLYPIAEEGGEDDRGAEDEQARPDKGDDRLGDAVLTRVHPDIYLECGDDDENGGNGIADIEDVEHHRHHIVVHTGKRIRAPAVVHAAALRIRRERQGEAQRRHRGSHSLLHHRRSIFDSHFNAGRLPDRPLFTKAIRSSSCS